MATINEIQIKLLPKLLSSKITNAIDTIIAIV